MQRREFVTAAGGVGLASVLGAGTSVGAAGAGYVREEHGIESFDGVEIPAVLFVPDDGADAAVLATHGWGGSKAGVEGYGPFFTDHGYAVLAFDQRGFGESTAEVGLSGPNEVNDVSALIDFIAADDRIEDGPDGTPRIGMIGRSYAGGIQMNAAAVDERIDALVPYIPWHDLTFSLAPNGVPKLGWTTLLYVLGVAGSRFGSANTDALDGGGLPVRPETFGDVENLQQGVTPRLHELYAKAVIENRIPEEGRAYLQSRSTVSKADRVDAPTLVVQGWPDTLFTPNEGHRIVEDVGADGTETNLALYGGGHTLNGSISPTAQVEYLDALALTWFDRHLRNEAVEVPAVTFWDVDRGEFREADGFPPSDAETVEFALSELEADDENTGIDDVSALFDEPVPGLSGIGTAASGVVDDTMAGLDDTLGTLSTETLPVGGSHSFVANTVAPTSASQVLPVNGDLLPLSVAEFDLAVEEPFEVLGTPTLSLSVTPLGTRTFCFGKVYRVRDDEAELLNNQAAPVAIEGTPGEPRTVEFELVAFQRAFEPGDTLRVALASTDGAFTTARGSAGFVVDHEASTLSLPVREIDDDGGGDDEDRNEGGGDDEDDESDEPTDGPTVAVEGPGTFALGDSLERVAIDVSDGPTFVRDAVPAGWTVETATHPYERTAPPETDANYVEFTGAVTDDRYYLARAPDGVAETNAYTFGPVEVRTPDGEWEPVEGTERRVLLAGVED